MKKTWREKLADDKGLPKVCEVRAGSGIRGGEGRMVVPAPREVDALMRQIPRGKLATISELRGALAKAHRADFTCPITTGIFSWIAAHAAAEDEVAGKKRVTPYWRTLKSTGEVNSKYPGGLEQMTKRLKAEGHQVIRKGKRTLVADFEKKIFNRFR